MESFMLSLHAQPPCSASTLSLHAQLLAASPPFPLQQYKAAAAADGAADDEAAAEQQQQQQQQTTKLL